MSTITVYIWDLRKGEAAGHASIGLSDGTYISWWPQGGVKQTGKLQVEAPAARNRKLQDDIDDEGCQPKRYRIKLTVDQENKIKTWFDRFRRTTTKYHLYNMNCSTVAYLALCEAFPELKNSVLNSIPVWMPFMIEMIAVAYGETDTLTLREINNLRTTINKRTSALGSAGGPQPTPQPNGVFGWVASWF